MILKINYLGHACFWIRSYDGVSVLIDPYNDTYGYSLPKPLNADIVMVSHNHAAHNCIEAVTGTPAVIQGPGYRELGWVKIRGLKSYHDRLNGEKFGQNTIFCWDIRAVKFCHLGDLGHSLSQELIDQIGAVDVLFVPIGGNTVLDQEEAEKVIKALNCKFVIPMHYHTKQNQRPLVTLEEFIKGKDNIIIPEPRNEFVVDRTNLAVKQKSLIALEYLDPFAKKSEPKGITQHV